MIIDRTILMKKITNIQNGDGLQFRSSTVDKKAIDFIMNELKSKATMMSKISGKSKSPTRAPYDDEPQQIKLDLTDRDQNINQSAEIVQNNIKIDE